MNHDVSHCSDYDPKVCPAKCYRAQVTAELDTRKDLIGIPLSFMHFFLSGDPECPRSQHYTPKHPHTWGGILRASNNEQLAQQFATWGYCPEGKTAFNDKRCKKHGTCVECWKAFLQEVP